MKPLKKSQYKPEYNYLKYYRTVEYYTRKKYDLTVADFHMILFLYSENYFTKTRFEEYAETVDWNKHRFDSLVRRGWIQVWRKKNRKWVNKYELSYKGKRMVTQLYEILNGSSPMPDSRSRNPLFKVNVPYMHKVHRNVIKKMNQEYKDRNS